MPNRAEQRLYKPCREWLKRFLAEKYPRDKAHILPGTESTYLRHAINRADMSELFPESPSWEVRVDVAAVVQRSFCCTLAFVELKVTPITLKDVGQLLGYCRVCRPLEAFLLSTSGLSTELERLLTTYGRSDVLNYEARGARRQRLVRTQPMMVGTWNQRRNEPDYSTLIPGGCLPQFD